MERRNAILIATGGAAAAGALAFGIMRRRAQEEMNRLAALLEWRSGATFADVVAGDGRFALRAVAR
jgi:hypothetical protein